jgi:hypothetical protein
MRRHGNGQYMGSSDVRNDDGQIQNSVWAQGEGEYRIAQVHHSNCVCTRMPGSPRIDYLSIGRVGYQIEAL